MSADHPVTPGVRQLRAAQVTFVPRLYEYEEKGGTRRSSEELGVPEHQVVKTLVMEAVGDGRPAPLVVLMHGDREVSTKTLARLLGVKTVRPCDPKTAEKHSGYQVGGTSPFGLKAALPVYVEATILALPWILINGGKRGFLVEIDPKELVRVLGAKPVEASA